MLVLDELQAHADQQHHLRPLLKACLRPLPGNMSDGLYCALCSR